MTVFPIVFVGTDPDATGCQGVCTSLELAIAKAEEKANEFFEEDPELAIAGFYSNTIETDYGTIVVIVEPKHNTVTDVWTITEEELEEE